MTIDCTRLRAPDGCPWDREQTPASLRPFVLEETYEVLEAIEHGTPQDLCEELGDFVFDHYSRKTGEAFVLDATIGPNGVSNVTAEQLAKLGITPEIGSTPSASTAYIRVEMARWKPVIEQISTFKATPK